MVISSQPWAGVEEKEPAGNGKEMNPSCQHGSLGATRVWTADFAFHGPGQGNFCQRLKFPLLSPECVLGLLSADRHTS